MTSAPPHIADKPSELPQIARHAATVLAGQLAVMAFGVTDTLVAGRDGDASLAALSVGSAIFMAGGSRVQGSRILTEDDIPLRGLTSRAIA